MVLKLFSLKGTDRNKKGVRIHAAPFLSQKYFMEQIQYNPFKNFLLWIIVVTFIIYILN